MVQYSFQMLTKDSCDWLHVVQLPEALALQVPSVTSSLSAAAEEHPVEGFPKHSSTSNPTTDVARHARAIIATTDFMVVAVIAGVLVLDISNRNVPFDEPRNCGLSVADCVFLFSRCCRV